MSANRTSHSSSATAFRPTSANRCAMCGPTSRRRSHSRCGSATTACTPAGLTNPVTNSRCSPHCSGMRNGCRSNFRYCCSRCSRRWMNLSGLMAWMSAKNPTSLAGFVFRCCAPRGRKNSNLMTDCATTTRTRSLTSENRRQSRRAARPRLRARHTAVRTPHRTTSMFETSRSPWFALAKGHCSGKGQSSLTPLIVVCGRGKVTGNRPHYAILLANAAKNPAEALSSFFGVSNRIRNGATITVGTPFR